MTVSVSFGSSGAIDNFDVPHNFLTEGVSGTVWDGYVVNGGVDATQNGVISALNTTTTPGRLRFQTSNTQWEGNLDDGALLYRNVTGDFTATVRIANGQFPSMPAAQAVNYHSAGLMARSPIAADRDYLYLNAFDRAEWGATHQFRSANNGEASYQVTNSGHLGNPSLASMPWLRLERAGSVFTASISADGVTWVVHSSYDRPDMPSSVQVGLAHAMFSANSGWVEFDNFSLETPCVLYNNPADGSSMVGLHEQLEWTFICSSVEFFDLYLSTEGEPNLSSFPANKLSMEPATTTSYDPALNPDTTYYWRIDTYEPNMAPDGEGYIITTGRVWNFSTILSAPVIKADGHPAHATVNVGDDAEFEVSYTTYSPVVVQWFLYVDGENDIALSDQSGLSLDPAKYEVASDGISQAQLTVRNTAVADEGYYYAVVRNAENLEAQSNPARLAVRRLVGHFPMDVIENSATPDVVSGYALMLANDQLETNLATLADGVEELGGKSLQLANTVASDPNFYGQYGLIEPGIVDYEDITVSVWVFWNGGGNWQRIIDFGNDTDNYMFLTPSHGSECRFAIRSAGGAEQFVATSPLPIGEWVHVTATRSGATGRLYVNGELRATNSGMSFSPINFKPQLNYIGKSHYADDPYFNGRIDDLKIYNYARTVEEVAQDYLAVRGEWVCDRTLPSLAYDFNGDCRVDLSDLATFALEWLESNRIYPAQ